AILMVVSYNMAEWHAFKTILRAPRSDVIVMLTTFFLTVFVDLTVGVEVGIFMAFALFVKRMSNVAVIREIKGEMETGENGEEALRNDRDSLSRRRIPKEVSIYEAEGAFFFGVAELLRDTLDVGQTPPKVLILRMRHVLALDATALRALRDLLGQCRRNKTQLLLSGIHVQPMFAIERAGFLKEMGEANVLENIDQALKRAEEIIGTRT
ncbi:MAG: STAS domain-containing protein, partial [Deltaproteobacteria bacterium]|nr:STAS domain-containing protein [Deltaproteobacteria bacterium]